MPTTEPHKMSADYAEQGFQSSSEVKTVIGLNLIKIKRLEMEKEVFRAARYSL